MKDLEKIKKYAGQVKIVLTPRLQQGIKMDVVIHPADSEGAVVEVVLDKDKSGRIDIKTSERTVNDILKKVPQKFVGGNIDAIKFVGTNISMEGNRILLIKGDNSNWSVADASSDIDKIFKLNKKG